jgi:hypothetical protein
VTDSASGKPIPGANVIVVGTEQGASTEADGMYTVIDLPQGDVTIEAGAVGYNPARAMVWVTPDRYALLDFRLARAPRGDLVEVFPARPAEAAGTVTDASTGLPLAGVEVSITPSGRKAVSDSAGRFRFDSLPSSGLTVRWWRSGYHVATREVSASGMPLELDRALYDTAQIGEFCGRVVDAGTGNPLNGAEVVLEAVGMAARADATGSFLIRRVPPGEYLARFGAAGHRQGHHRVTIVPGKCVPRDFGLALD